MQGSTNHSSQSFTKLQSNFHFHFISISIFNFLAGCEFMTQPYNSSSSSSSSPPPSSLSFVALVVVKQPAAFVDSIACFDECHGHHDILHCSVVGTAGFLLFMGAFIIVLHTCFFHCCHCHSVFFGQLHAFIFGLYSVYKL